MNIWWVLVAATVAGFVYFAATYVMLKRQMAALPKVEQAAVLIEDATDKRSRVPLRQRVRAEMTRRGWDGNYAPLILFGLLGTFAVALVMTLLNVPPLLALAAAVPIVLLSLWFLDGYRVDRRARKFNRQLVQVLELLVAEVEASNGPGLALQRIPLSLPEPARTEFDGAADRIRVGAHLDDAVRPIAEKYPSRSMSLILSALRIDRERGAALGPALRQAADTLRRDIELTEETVAEIAQTKFEFGIICAVFGFIAFAMVFTSGQQEIFFGTTIGLIGLLFCAVNVSFGIFRAFRMMSKIQKVGQ